MLTVLTDHSSTALGIVTGLQFLPFLLLAPWAGHDRRPVPQAPHPARHPDGPARRTSLLLGVLAVTGVVELWQSTRIALFQGVATAVDNPARQTFVSEMVPERPAGQRRRPQQRVVQRSAASSARASPAWSSPLFGIGAGAAAQHLDLRLRLVALALLRPRELRPGAAVTRGKGAIREGLRYVRSRPDLMLVMAAGLRARHVRHELPDHHGADGHQGVRQGRRRSTACSARSWPSAR